jgi:D-aminoacyl-tRNA deacylase
MRVVVQRVKKAHVSVKDEIVGQIDQGYLLYIGIQVNDDLSVVQKMAEKVHHLRIFEDEAGKMNLNLSQVQGQVLAISQFTLYGDTKGNNRPSFILAARPEQASTLYEAFIEALKRYHHVEKGLFGAHMEIHSVNDGPVTILIEMN